MEKWEGKVVFLFFNGEVGREGLGKGSYRRINQAYLHFFGLDASGDFFSSSVICVIRLILS